LALLAGAVLGLVLFAALARRLDAALVFGVFAIPLGIIGARVVFCLVRISFIAGEYGLSFVVNAPGGFSLMGAVLGVAAAAVITARIVHKPRAYVMDIAAPSAMLTLAAARFGEAFTTDGIGRFTENPWFARIPFAVPHADFTDEWHVAVFIWEGLAALAIAVVGAIIFRRNSSKQIRHGDAAATAATLFAASQILLESLREDSFLRFGFVRLNQLLCVALIICAAVFWLRGAGARRVWVVACGLAACVGALVRIEFALDKSTMNNNILYGIMVAVLVVIAGLLFYGRGGDEAAAK
jgi:phosphatidylglycerol:prolipoprotein diacylglycerol transferase